MTSTLGGTCNLTPCSKADLVGFPPHSPHPPVTKPKKKGERLAPLPNLDHTSSCSGSGSGFGSGFPATKTFSGLAWAISLASLIVASMLSWFAMM